MFGSKIRSWMENHIVRPRKKGNKNKNANSNLGLVNLQNGHKGNQYQNESTTLGSPAARRYHEVSPIQNNKTSRQGWQSPNQEPPVSPKSDHYAYQQHVIHSPPNLSSFSSSSSPKSISSKSNSYTLDPRLAANSQYSKSVDSHVLTTMYSIKEKSDYRKSNISSTSSSGVATLSTSSYGNNNNNNVYDPNTTLNFSTPTSSSNELLDESHGNNRRLSTNKHVYESIKLTSSSSSASSVHAMAKQFEPTHRQQVKPFENHYGKIQQPIAHKTKMNDRGPVKSYDQCNGNPTQEIVQHHATLQQHNASHQQPSFNSKPIVGNDKNCDNLTNNNNLVSHAKTNANHAVAHLQSMNAKNNNTLNSNGNSKIVTYVPSSNGGIRTISNRGYANTNKIQQSFATIGASYYHHNHHQMQQQLPPAHSLSSPESAYSTGYSTGYSDTSPGGCSNTTTNTPEYYINIRTGTHYFPKGINPMGIDSNNRFKCGLNRIEEKHVEFIADDKIHYENYKQTEICDVPYNKNNITANKTSSSNQLQPIDNNRINYMGVGKKNLNNNSNNNHATNQQHQHLQSVKQQQNVTPPKGMSPILPKSNVCTQNFRSIESPSPRQRCRIRTNPWFFTAEAQATLNGGFEPKKHDMDTGSTSSGIKSNSDGAEEKNDFKNGLPLTDSDSSTSTEKNLSRKSTQNNSSIISVKANDSAAKKAAANSSMRSITLTNTNTQDSDEDATLNEMMGKFDESYVYEKETDILSDSDPTDCASDLDTGQDAGDECDTDDLLELDYIDTGSVQEVADNDANKNTGSCSYHQYPPEKRASRNKKGKKPPEESGSKRKKKLTRKKKNSESHSGRTPRPTSRGCRSLGGTPVCLRRHQPGEILGTHAAMQPATRTNSLTFTEIHSIHSRLMAISESEKALLRADLEADVKYKQLIHEAETILVSMKTNAATANKEAPMISPRRLCQIPTNKRVEMLRNCEADLKREIAKSQAQNGRAQEISDNLSPSEGFIVNKRLEILRYETVSAPNSPKYTRAAPLKTHLTNFIHQNVEPADLLRKNQNPAIDPVKKHAETVPKLHHNGHHITHKPPKSPVPSRRRYRSQSPRHCIASDSDSDEKVLKSSSKRDNKNKENQKSSRTISNHKSSTIEIIHNGHQKPPLISFRSVDIGNNMSDELYCPQSEPLKRKIYAGSSTYDRLQRTLDIESEIPKRALLNKISLIRRERQAAKTIIESTSTTTHFYQRQPPVCDAQQDSSDATSENFEKILTTIQDIKRSLEDQSVELCELNESDN